MKIDFNLEVILLLGLIAQGFFAAALLVIQKENRRANVFLAILLITFSLWMCDTFFRASGIYDQNPNYYFLPIYFSLAFGPLAYFYTRSLTNPNFRFQAFHLIHFLPVLLQLGLYTFLQTRDYRFRRAFWFDIHQPYTYDLEFIATLFSLLIYLILSIRLLQSYKQRIRNQFSDIAKITLNWLRVIQWVLISLTVLWLADASFRFFLDYYPQTPLSTISIGFALLLLAGGGLTQSDLSKMGKDYIPLEEDPQISNNDLDPQLLAAIRQVMSDQMLFLRSELSLHEFAQELNRPGREVSRHINNGLGMSFIDFVNQYRVERVKQLMERGRADQLTLLGIALESGFNSKATFNRVFKKFTGKSPSAYQNGIQNRF